MFTIRSMEKSTQTRGEIEFHNKIIKLKYFPSDEFRRILARNKPYIGVKFGIKIGMLTKMSGFTVSSYWPITFTIKEL